MIPVLSVQPLVENAVKHGIAAKGEQGRVCLRAEYEPGGLRISVQDTGIGFERSARRLRDGTGVGLTNVRRRLTLSYGPDADLVIQSNDLGSSVSFLIPNRKADSRPLTNEKRSMVTN